MALPPVAAIFQTIAALVDTHFGVVRNNKLNFAKACKRNMGRGRVKSWTYLLLILKFLYIFFVFTILNLIEHNYKLPRKISQLFQFLFL